MWLYVPNTSTSSHSAPEAEASISASSWQFQALERSAWSRGKLSRSRNWYQLWKRALWLQRLYGVMPEPSTAASGVDAWTASLAASRANLTVLPANEADQKTSATFGQMHGASSSNPVPVSSSSKTSAACSRRRRVSIQGRFVSGVTYSDWASTLREDCSRRQKSAQAMSASGSSSSVWPTPQVADINQDRGGMEYAQKKFEQSGYPNLANSAKMFQASAWPTPTANDHKGSGPTMMRQDGKMRGDRLDYATEQLWYTPNVPNGGRTLSADTSPTGMTKDGVKRQVGLENQDNMWMTPRSHEVGQYQYSRGDKSKPVETLTGQAFSRPDLMTTTVGEAHSRPRRSLNPLFVEWLMGWPPGWTLLAWTDFACSETALSLFKQRMRSALSQLGLPAEAPPAQLALFG